METGAVPPFDFSSTVKQWGVHPPLEHLKDGTYYRAFQLPSKALVTVATESLGTVEEPRLRVALHADDPLADHEEEEAIERVRWVLGLDEDLEGFYSLAEEDPLLRSVREDLYGMRVRASGCLSYAVALAIALQNAPVARSRQMLRLLTERLGSEAPSVDGLRVYAFPSEEVIAEASGEELIRCKWGYRADRLKDAAAVIREGGLTIAKLRVWPMEEVKAVLCGIKGVGEYSAEIVALDALRKYEAFPLDSWSSRIFSRLYFGGEGAGVERLRRFAEERWGMYRGLAFVYILNDLDKLSKKSGVELV